MLVICHIDKFLHVIAILISSSGIFCKTQPISDYVKICYFIKKDQVLSGQHYQFLD